MKVNIVGTDQVLEFEGTLNVGDLLHFTSTMAVVEVDGEKDEAKAALVANTANGIRTSELFEKLTPAQDEEETEEDDG